MKNSVNNANIKSSKWLRNKGATINPQNYDDNKCFQYGITAGLNYQNIEKHLEIY